MPSESPSRPFSVCVFGAGAIGGHLAARLDKGGAAVSVVVRGPHLEAIRRDGLRVETPAETMLARPVATDDPAALGPQDAVLVAVKAPALPSVAAAIGPLLGPDTAVAFVMNGIPWWYDHGLGGAGRGGPGDATALLDPGGALAAAVGADRALGGVIYSACTVTAPGVVKVEQAAARLVLGEPDGSVSARVEALAAPLRRGGVTVDVTDHIRTAVWSKLMLNLGSGMLGVLSGATPGEFFREPACQEATRRVLAEAAAVAAALGCPVVPDVDGQIRNGLRSAHKTSILQDLELGRPMEIDALYTVPLAMARQAGVDTPTLDLLAALTRARARAAGLYRD